MATLKIFKQKREVVGFLLGICLAGMAIISTLYYQNAFQYFQQTLRLGIKTSQSVARYEEKLFCLRDEFAPDSIVGFITLVPSAQAAEYHQLTQYALVPVLVELSTENSLVVGYVPDPDDIQVILKDHPDYRIVKDCGNEIVLFGRTP